MKKPIIAVLLFILFIVAIIACQNNEHAVEQVQYYASGQVSRRYYELKGKKDGIMTDYYPDGKVLAERFFKQDIQTGHALFYHTNGKVKETQYYDANGIKQKDDSTFYDNGKLQLLLSFRDGKKHGYLRKWSSDGLLTYEARYVMDTLVEVKGKLLNRGSF